MNCDLSSLLSGWAARNGCRASWLPTSVIADAADRIAALRSNGDIDETLYRRFLSEVAKTESVPGPNEKSIILVAVPSPSYIVTFEYRGRDHELILPPTYYNYRGVFEEVRESLGILFDNRVPLRTITAPLKGTAVLSGFAKYGLNNITYVDGMGSYVQLVAFAAPAEVPSRSDAPSPLAMVLEECAACGACLRGCPSRAIRRDRFLLHAEQCLTYFSETECDLPEKYASLKRRCLVGCLVCQETCPVNKGKLKWEKLDIRFSEAETEFILRNSSADPTPELCKKLTALKCSEFSTPDGHPTQILQRNLSAVISS